MSSHGYIGGIQMVVLMVHSGHLSTNAATAASVRFQHSRKSACVIPGHLSANASTAASVRFTHHIKFTIYAAIAGEEDDLDLPVRGGSDGSLHPVQRDCSNTLAVTTQVCADEFL